MNVARSSLPGVRERYFRSLARVRVLEDEIARSPAKAKELQPLYEAEQRNLQDSQFLLEQTLNNAATGESRQGLEAMREAAQKKTIDIADKIAAGEEVVLEKMDYNPDLIKRAAALGKNKLVPGLRKGDFNTQVHEAYQDIYKQRLGQLNQQISELEGNRNLNNLYQAQRLEEEKEVIQKLINHVDAENALTRHKLGLRELQARQTLQKRMKKLVRVPGEPKVAEAAKGKTNYQKQYKAAATPEAKANVIDDAAEKIASETGKPKESVVDALNEVKQTTGKVGQTFHEAGKANASGAAIKKEVRNVVNEFKDAFSKLPNVKEFIYTPAGRDVFLGIVSGTFDEYKKDIGSDFPVSGSQLATVGLSIMEGERIGQRGFYRYIISAITKGIIRKVKKENYKGALKSHDEAALSKYGKSYSPAIIKKAKKEFRESSG
jgi:hypothetical protein